MTCLHLPQVKVDGEVATLPSTSIKWYAQPVHLGKPIVAQIEDPNDKKHGRLSSIHINPDDEEKNPSSNELVFSAYGWRLSHSPWKQIWVHER